jgi:hypothetical protein
MRPPRRIPGRRGPRRFSLQRIGEQLRTYAQHLALALVELPRLCRAVDTLYGMSCV